MPKNYNYILSLFGLFPHFHPKNLIVTIKIAVCQNRQNQSCLLQDEDKTRTLASSHHVIVNFAQHLHHFVVEVICQKRNRKWKEK